MEEDEEEDEEERGKTSPPPEGDVEALVYNSGGEGER